jgi:hypothetical protein
VPRLIITSADPETLGHYTDASLPLEKQTIFEQRVVHVSRNEAEVQSPDR